MATNLAIDDRLIIEAQTDFHLRQRLATLFATLGNIPFASAKTTRKSSCYRQMNLNDGHPGRYFFLPYEKILTSF